MGQNEIQEVLSKFPERLFAGKELMSILNVSYTSINHSLKTMRDRNEVGWIKNLNRKMGCPMYRYKYKGD